MRQIKNGILVITNEPNAISAFSYQLLNLKVACIGQITGLELTQESSDILSTYTVKVTGIAKLKTFTGTLLELSSSIQGIYNLYSSICNYCGSDVYKVSMEPVKAQFGANMYCICLHHGRGANKGSVWFEMKKLAG